MPKNLTNLWVPISSLSLKELCICLDPINGKKYGTPNSSANFQIQRL